MVDKPDLTAFTTSPITELPIESAQDFKHWVLVDGLKPSAALRKLMDKYNCPNPDPSVVIQLVELTYPNVDVSRQNFTFKIVDSRYPNSDSAQFNDEDFDRAVEELISLPPGW